MLERLWYLFALAMMLFVLACWLGQKMFEAEVDPNWLAIPALLAGICLSVAFTAAVGISICERGE